MRRAVAVLTIALGALLIVFPLAFSLFDRTADAERILDRFEFLALDDNPNRYLSDAEVTRDGSSQLVDEAIPALAAEAGLSEAELEQRFPALATARIEVPEAEEFSIRYSAQLEEVEDKFQSVYDIPVSGLPLTATPWLFLLAGGFCLAAGIVTLRSESRGSLVAILALGATMALGPVALGAVAKATDGEDVKDFASNGLTERAADAARSASAALDELVVETGEQTLPFLAERTGQSPEQLGEELDGRFPDAGEFLAQWEAIGLRLSELADAVSVSVEEFDSAEEMPIAAPVWFLLAAGALLVIGAALALRRERERPA